jgi:hypothetical protein
VSGGGAAGGECGLGGHEREGESEREREMPNHATNKAGGWAGERNANGAGATTKRAERERVG